MKKITLTIRDDADVDLNELMRKSLSFRVDDITALEKGDAPTRQAVRFADKTTVSTIMKHYIPQGQITVAIVSKWMMDEGFNPNSATPALRDLQLNGYLTKVPNTTGTYQYTGKQFSPGQLRCAA